MSDPVAILLDDAMPPERLGSLLRAARKRRGWSRKHAAAKAGTTPACLRAYERGEKTIPIELCTKLAACYGDDLLAHVPARTPELVDDALDASEHGDVIETYARLVRRVRRCKPGEPIELRTSDVAAIAAALGLTSDELETRIAAALGCTREEARALHRGLLRRRVILPVAGLAAGVVAFGGIAYAASGSGQPVTPAPAPAPAPVVHIAHAIAARFAPSTTTVPAPTPSTALTHPQPTTVVPVPKPAPEPITDATIVQTDPPPTTTTTAPPDGTVSILPGETPKIIEGPPDK